MAFGLNVGLMMTTSWPPVVRISASRMAYRTMELLTGATKMPILAEDDELIEMPRRTSAEKRDT